MAAAFQGNAFQANAFQVGAALDPPTDAESAGATARVRTTLVSVSVRIDPIVAKIRLPGCCL